MGEARILKLTQKFAKGEVIDGYQVAQLKHLIAVSIYKQADIFQHV
ncbi:protein of unknown function [Shewanella benthica]|uniref:Uncharacterized protein n=1 Tax=Shewanella benthica TaxID=43661 RepID=A0A330M1I4_9GAMM|nr:protein of unknown function [Shewanella benthica]